MIRKNIYSVMAGIGLLLCLAAPFLYFWGTLTEKGYKWLFLGASILWFLFATLRVFRRTPPSF